MPFGLADARALRAQRENIKRAIDERMAEPNWSIARCFEAIDRGMEASGCSCQGWGRKRWTTC